MAALQVFEELIRDDERHRGVRAEALCVAASTGSDNESRATTPNLAEFSDLNPWAPEWYPPNFWSTTVKADIDPWEDYLSNCQPLWPTDNYWHPELEQMLPAQAEVQEQPLPVVKHSGRSEGESTSSGFHLEEIEILDDEFQCELFVVDCPTYRGINGQAMEQPNQKRFTPRMTPRGDVKSLVLRQKQLCMDAAALSMRILDQRQHEERQRDRQATRELIQHAKFLGVSKVRIDDILRAHRDNEPRIRGQVCAAIQNSAKSSGGKGPPPTFGKKSGRPSDTPTHSARAFTRNPQPKRGQIFLAELIEPEEGAMEAFTVSTRAKGKASIPEDARRMKWLHSGGDNLLTTLVEKHGGKWITIHGILAKHYGLPRSFSPEMLKERYKEKIKRQDQPRAQPQVVEDGGGEDGSVLYVTKRDRVRNG